MENEAVCPLPRSHEATLDHALTEGLTAEAEGRVMSLEDAAAQVKAKIRDAAARRAKA